MTSDEILSAAESRILEHRTARARLHLEDEQGRAIARANARVRLVRHEFKLGANAFGLRNPDDPEAVRAYGDRFAALLNYATLPFYWGYYEPEKDAPQQDRLESMAAWCRERRITAKGHPLAWHEVFPKWAESLEDRDVLRRLERRVRDIVAHFRGLIDIWDVVNEATVSARFDNAVGRWMKERGTGACVADALAWAHDANPDATLLYNDFNVSAEFEALAAALLAARAPVHTLGIQSHMHKGTWPIEKVWHVCETYARFGLPLHFTENTILSGRLKAPDDNDWHKRHDDWPSTAEGEAAQLAYGSQFYTLLFSHPAVEAITCWDFSDKWSWQGAPSGLVRRDMSPKPLYDWLMDAFHKRWTTDAEVITDARGDAQLPCFFGEHEVSVRTESGRALSGTFVLSRRGSKAVTVSLRSST